MSNTTENKTGLPTQSGDTKNQYNPYQAPCPTCGRCPTCGKGGYQPPPYYPYWNYLTGQIPVTN